MSFQFYEETILCVLAAIGIVAIFREITMHRIMHKFGQKLTLFVGVTDENSSASALAVRSAVLYCFPCLDIKIIERGTEENGEGAYKG